MKCKMISENILFNYGEALEGIFILKKDCILYVVDLNYFQDDFTFVKNLILKKRRNYFIILPFTVLKELEYLSKSDQIEVKKKAILTNNNILQLLRENHENFNSITRIALENFNENSWEKHLNDVLIDCCR